MLFQKIQKYLLTKELISRLKNSKTNLKTQLKVTLIVLSILQLIKNQQRLLINQKKMFLSDFQLINLENRQLKKSTDLFPTLIL